MNDTQDATDFFMMHSMRLAIMENIQNGNAIEVTMTLRTGEKATYSFEKASVHIAPYDTSSDIVSPVAPDDASPGIFGPAFSYHLERMEAVRPPPLDLNQPPEAPEESIEVSLGSVELAPVEESPEPAVRYCAGPCGQELPADHRHVRCQACNNDWYLRNSGNCTPCKEDGCIYVAQKGMPLCRSCFSGRREGGWCVKPNCHSKVTGGHKLCRQCYIEDPRTQERHGAMLKADVERASLHQEKERARRRDLRK